MTRQMLTFERPVSTSTNAQTLEQGNIQQDDSSTAVPSNSLRLVEKAKALYQEPQQEKFFNLQAEAESLLQQLQMLKQQRQESASAEADSSEDGSVNS